MLRHVLLVLATLLRCQRLLVPNRRPRPCTSIRSAAAVKVMPTTCGSNGFKITVKETHDMSLIRRQHGVPEKLDGCHIMIIDGYVVEGHVPAASIKKLLAERPKIKGISLPGMPDGSPGMTGRKSEPFTIYEISDGEPKVFAVE